MQATTIFNADIKQAVLSVLFGDECTNAAALKYKQQIIEEEFFEDGLPDAKHYIAVAKNIDSWEQAGCPETDFSADGPQE